MNGSNQYKPIHAFFGILISMTVFLYLLYSRSKTIIVIFFLSSQKKKEEGVGGFLTQCIFQIALRKLGENRKSAAEVLKDSIEKEKPDALFTHFNEFMDNWLTEPVKLAVTGIYFCIEAPPPLPPFFCEHDLNFMNGSNQYKPIHAFFGILISMTVFLYLLYSRSKTIIVIFFFIRIRL
jgi:uncharacterized MnhB-related membrane protein